MFRFSIQLAHSAPAASRQLPTFGADQSTDVHKTGSIGWRAPVSNQIFLAQRRALLGGCL
jgi:hypothetical protein